MDLANLEKYLIDNNINYRKNVDLKLLSYSQTGNCVLYYVEPKNLDELIKIYREFYSILFLIGESTNILFVDSVRYKSFLSIGLLRNIEFNNDTVTVEAGANLSYFLRQLYSRDVAGFEGLEGIPGSVGGAVYMNAGAYGFEISDRIICVNCIDYKGNLISLNKNECDFSNRCSVFQQNELLIYSVKFDIQQKSKCLCEKVEKMHISRHSYQEFVYPNLGSIFATKDIYKDIANSNMIYKVMYVIIKIIFYNKIMRLFNRRKPNKKVLNDFTIIFFKLSKNKMINSHKTLNCFVNKNYSTNEIINYYSLIYSILPSYIKLENIVLIDNIESIINEFEYRWTEKKLKELGC